jgi:uncharacterized protein YndB with AHSA1/START domain
MGKSFEEGNDAEVAASPEQVWAAIATGPGIDSWFMGRNEVRPGPDGTVRTVFGGYTPELAVTAWDPPRRFGYRSPEEPDGRFIAYEFLIEGRAGGSTVLRTVTSGFIPGDDWGEEFEAMRRGGQGYFRTLVEYLTWFPGRFAVPVTVFGPAGTAWERDRRLLCSALGLPDSLAPGSPVRITPAGTRPGDGVVYLANDGAIGVRTADAFYRFLGGFGHPMVADHALFAAGTDPEQATRAWESWLARILSPQGETS